ncbi:MAG TPA: hypothetical protein DDZ80_16265 [Cyanobacteria bacterium UBA8803]|nr:hypothetical protein [Cyanobacteria bacterium UBA9273]HBL59967.1 hypothetical protein [Cyanobacteria bacterium UBA8803]
MQLSYRGVHYQSETPTIETTESKIGGKYRGADLQFRRRKGIFVPDSFLRLKYRGTPHLALGRFSVKSQPHDLPNSGYSPLTLP